MRPCRRIVHHSCPRIHDAMSTSASCGLQLAGGWHVCSRRSWKRHDSMQAFISTAAARHSPSTAPAPLTVANNVARCPDALRARLGAVDGASLGAHAKTYTARDCAAHLAAGGVGGDARECEGGAPNKAAVAQRLGARPLEALGLPATCGVERCKGAGIGNYSRKHLST